MDFFFIPDVVIMIKPQYIMQLWITVLPSSSCFCMINLLELSHIFKYIVSNLIAL